MALYWPTPHQGCIQTRHQHSRLHQIHRLCNGGSYHQPITSPIQRICVSHTSETSACHAICSEGEMPGFMMIRHTRNARFSVAHYRSCTSHRTPLRAKPKGNITLHRADAWEHRFIVVAAAARSCCQLTPFRPNPILAPTSFPSMHACWLIPVNPDQQV